MTTEAEFLTSYEQIKTSYKAAMAKVDEAISHEEQEKPREAIVAYEHSLQLIDEVFAIPVGLPDDVDNVAVEWQDACATIQKLKSAKTETTYRLKMVRQQQAPVDGTGVEAMETPAEENGEPAAKKRPLLLENPPTYFDIDNASGSPKTYREIIKGLRDVIATKDSGVLFDTLFHAKVKLYKIQVHGEVSRIAGETTMSVVMCTVGGKWQFLNGTFFIQCTMPEAPEADNLIWLYPLVPTVTHCYRTAYGAFILPDLEAEVPGTAFGLMLCDSTESPSGERSQEPGELTDLEQFLLDLLEAILAGTVEELQQPAGAQPGDTSRQVSKTIVNTADFIARNLVRGAEKTGEYMVKSTPYIMSKLTPAPADAPPVSSTLQTSVNVAKNVTGAAVGVTGWVAGKVGSASMALGRFLAPHIQRNGAALLEKGFGYDSTEANSKMEGALTIAAGAVEGFSTVYHGLETSAKILGNSLSDNSVKIIEHKYGPSAGNVAAGTFDTLGNAFTVSQNVNYITPKGIAKKMAKTTGKAVVDDYKRGLRHESHIVPAGSLYPDLRALKDK